MEFESPLLFKNEPLSLVLDGLVSVGKTCWLNPLTTGHYKKEQRTIPHTEFVQTCDYKAVVKGAKYKTVIFDTNGEKSKFRTNNFEIYKRADVIIEFFSIDRPTSFDEVIDNRIPFMRSNFSKTPILLVGTMSDAKNAPKPKKSYFPSAFGPFVAKRVGAFKYVECSALNNFNVNKVVEEAIWAASTASCRMGHDVYQDVNSMVIDKVSPGSEWLDRIIQLNVKQYQSFCTETDTSFVEDLVFLDRTFAQFQPAFRKLKEGSFKAFKELYISRSLELERILISHSRNETVLCDLRQPTFAMWYTLEAKDMKAVRFYYFQPFYDHDVLHVINTTVSEKDASDSAMNLFVVQQDCSEVMDLLTTTRNLRIRSLVIVDCDGTLTFSFLSNLNHLEYLVIKNTCVAIDTLDFPSCLSDTMKHLVLNNCGIIEPMAVPSVIGKLKNLELLNFARNNFESFPAVLSGLRNIKLLLIDRENVLESPSTEGVKKSAPEIFGDLPLMPEKFAENKVTKLVVVGQKKVGKTTLINALKNISPESPDDEPAISILCLDNDIKCNVYDLVQDVECLNTHPLVFSPYALNMVVFNLSQVTLERSKKFSLEFNLCRLGLWLTEIASQGSVSHAIIVGTHADASSVCEDILQINRMLIKNLLSKYGPAHKREFSAEPSKNCIICHPELAPVSVKGEPNTVDDSSEDDISRIPHILGYFEVSVEGKSKTGVSELKPKLNRFLNYLMKESKCNQICEKWFLLRTLLEDRISTSSDLKKEPVMPLSRIHELATDCEVYDEHQVLELLRFFHSQGTYLWYEDVPEMKDIVILDPQWLSDQLRTLICHRPSVSSICDGVLPLSKLSIVRPQISDVNRGKLLALFRSVGLCFSISDTEELFPYNLPVGWPDREIWPPLPSRGENQTSLLFQFQSSLPPSFFPDLIAEVNKQTETFVKHLKPLYYRFHIVYIRKDQRGGISFDEVDTSGKSHDSNAEEDASHLSRVHFEFMPYNNSLTVAVRGHDPPSIIPDIRSTIETVKRRRYPGISYSESMLCPVCVMNRVKVPHSFKYDVPHDGVCSKGHSNIFHDRYSSKENVSWEMGQTGRVVGDTRKDQMCPKKFVILPRNFANGLSLLDRFSRSNFIIDGFTLHLLCECPDQCHFVAFPGFSVAKAKPFLEKHGKLLSTGLWVFYKACSAVGATPLRIAVVPATLALTLYEYIQHIHKLCLDKYPTLKASLGSPKGDLRELESVSGLEGSELSRFLEVEAKGRNFGPMVCTYVDKRNEWLWLCEEHNKRFEIIQRNDQSLDRFSQVNESETTKINLDEITTKNDVPSGIAKAGQVLGACALGFSISS